MVQPLGNFEEKVLPRFLARLYGEAAAQPLKAAALLALALAALWLWGRRLPSLIPGLSTVGGTTGEIATLPVSPPDTRSGTGPVSLAHVLSGSLGWIAELETLVRQSEAVDQNRFIPAANPFRPPATAATENVGNNSQSHAQWQQALATPPAHNAGTLNPAKKEKDAKPVAASVRAIVITQSYRAAIVDEKLCFLAAGEAAPKISLRLGPIEEEFEVVAIEEHGVVLENPRQRLWIPLGSGPPRVQIRPKEAPSGSPGPRAEASAIHGARASQRPIVLAGRCFSA